MSGTITITPGYTFPNDTTAVTHTRLNSLGNPTAVVDAGAITARELGASVLPVDPSAYFVLFDDFPVSNSISGFGTNNLRSYSTGTAAALTYGTATAAHPGVITLETGTDTTGTAWLRDSGTVNGVVLGGGETTIAWHLRTPAGLSDGTDTYTLYAGLGNGASSGAEPTDGVYFLYTHGTNSGNWVGKTANSSTRTSVNSNLAVVAPAWVTLQATVNAAASSVEFFVNGVSIGTSSTNIPTSPVLGPVVGITKSAGISGKNFLVDWVKLNVTFTTAR